MRTKVDFGSTVSGGIQHGYQINNIFGIEPGAPTYSEAQYLLGFRTTDEIRNRVTKARQERLDRLRAKGILPEGADSQSTVDRQTPSTPSQENSTTPDTRDRLCDSYEK